MKKYALKLELLKNLDSYDLKLTYHFINKLVNSPKSIIATVTSVSRSGMSRRVKFGMVHKNRLIDISYLIPKLTTVCSFKRDYREVYVTGAGMDMVFHILYSACRVIKNKNTRARAHRNACYYMTF